MEKTLRTIPVPFAKVTNVEQVNPEFTKVSCVTFGVGKNRNYSYVSKDELDKGIESVYYTPVVGHLIDEYDKDGKLIGRHFGGHDYKLDSDLNFVPLTVPFGVVVKDSARYETIQEYGQDVEYLVVDCYLWTGRYPALKECIYDENGVWFNQSVELNYGQSRPLAEDSNYQELMDISFSALCILGKSDDPSKNVEPCFISAGISPNYNFALEGKQFSQAMAEMREQLAVCFENNASKKGGQVSLTQEKIDAIFAVAKLAIADVDFEITEDMTEEQLQAALEDFKKRKECAADPEPAEPAEPAEPTQEPAEPAKVEAQLFSATANQKREALRNALDSVVTYNADGSVQSEINYWVEDYDDTHVFVERCYWTATDYESKYGRFPYTFDEQNKTASVTGEFEEMVKMWLTKDEANKVEAERNELDALRKFKKDTEDAKFQAEVDTVLADFEDLSSLEEFASIKEKAYEAESIDALQTQLFALRGRHAKVPKRSPANFSVKVPVDHTAPVDDEPYGGIFSKYNIKPSK